MAAIGTMTATVASEEVYEFSAYPWGTVFKPLGAVFVSAPSEAWCILQGESPCRARVSHPPVSSVA